MTRQIAQCRKTVMTPLGNIQGTRNIRGYFFNENLRPNQQLDVSTKYMPHELLVYGIFLKLGTVQQNKK